eukprot:5956537-Prymnesium_polylepis.1
MSSATDSAAWSSACSDATVGDDSHGGAYPGPRARLCDGAALKAAATRCSTPWSASERTRFWSPQRTSCRRRSSAARSSCSRCSRSSASRRCRSASRGYMASNSNCEKSFAV